MFRKEIKTSAYVLYIYFKDIIKEQPPKLLLLLTLLTLRLYIGKKNIKKEPSIKKEKTPAVKKELVIRKRALF